MSVVDDPKVAFIPRAPVAPEDAPPPCRGAGEPATVYLVAGRLVSPAAPRPPAAAR